MNHNGKVNTKGNKLLGVTTYHLHCVVAFIKYYAHIDGATKFCNGLLECGSWFASDHVYELGLFNTTYTIFKFH